MVLDSLAPGCASVGSGITTVTLNVHNIPLNGKVALTIDSYEIPPQSDSGAIGARVADSGVQTFTYGVDSMHYYVFLLVATDPSGKAKPVKFRWKCGFEDTLSLSIGTLFTEIPYRSYNQQQVPSASGTQNVLVVSDTGR